MKVLQINAVYGQGSTGTIVQHIQQACESKGIDCYVAYSKSYIKVKNGYKIGGWCSSKLHAILCRLAGKQGYYSSRATRRFIRFIDVIKPDIIHLHNLHSNFINISLLFNYISKNDIKTIITLHDCWWYTGGCFHYSYVDCYKWLESCGSCPKRFNDTPALLFDASKQILRDKKYLVKSINHLFIVGVSNWISNEAKKSFLRRWPIKTIYNGIDFSVFRPSPSSLRKEMGLEGKYVLLGPASKWLSPVNSYILDFFVDNLNDSSVLVLFGNTCKKHSPSNKIILYKYTRDKYELAKLYSMADVFVNCSREESLGLINIEAQACGTPVVSFSGTGVSETVCQQNLVEMGNAKQLLMKAMSIDRAFIDLTCFEKNRAYEAYTTLYFDFCREGF